MSQNFDSQDVEQNKVLGGLGHLVFFVPLLACPSSAFGKHAANQGLIGLAILVVARFIDWILGGIPVIGGLIGLAMWLVQIVIALLMVYFTYVAITQGDSKEFPVIGSIKLLK